MATLEEISHEISILMPMIARRIFMDYFEDLDITQTQLLTVIALYEQSPCRLSELTARLNIAAPTTTGIIDRLKNRGYVKRVPDTQDRRVVNVSLTEKGLKLAKSFRTTIKNKWKDMLENIPKDDSENYLRILRKIQANLKQI